ncbi:DUF6328 family protein [Pseudonocardia acidicola]|uniref:DUF6328 family protein n=1 Tax=Pseudonocardia acidicola TaxID=2724939 RepID=UPI001EF15AE7|nr:DUF6328 family protein [Pseudonocardia acidicola]
MAERDGEPSVKSSGEFRDRRAEGPLERADRNVVELLQEVRVAQTGVQILFAFLLSLSFTDRFGRVDPTQRAIYVVTLLLAVVTTALLVAPVAVHRMVFRRGMKEQLAVVGHRLAVLGLAGLALTLTGCILLVLDVTLGRKLAIVLAAAVALCFGVLWFVLPLPLRARRSSR